jgi:hypothetical protein
MIARDQAVAEKFRQSLLEALQEKAIDEKTAAHLATLVAAFNEAALELSPFMNIEPIFTEQQDKEAKKWRKSQRFLSRCYSTEDEKMAEIPARIGEMSNKHTTDLLLNE